MKQKSLFICLLSLIFAAAMPQMQAQNSRQYAAINENKLLQTKWKYTYTTHTESNTIIHKADKDYKYYLFLKYDNTVQTYINGKIIDGQWALNEAKNELIYDFRRIKSWRIAEFTNNVLVLEYNLHAKAAYRYHFVSVTDAEAPFVRSAFDLPDVLVINQLQTGDKFKFRGVKDEPGKRLLTARQIRKDAKKAAKKAKNPPKEAPVFIQIELVGGGFYGGMDKVLRNNLVIKTDGKVVREFETERNGLSVTRRTIARKDLEALVKYIESKQFFTFDQTYTCQTGDCQKRMQELPRPVALRLSVTYGFRRKLVMIPIWDGQGHDKAILQYPPELDAIVRAIESLALYP